MQGALTVITRIAPGRTESLRSLLNAIGNAVENNELVPFVQMTTVHFARWVILPERRSEADDATFPAQLVLATSYDKPLDTHLEELVHGARRGFDSIYEHCVGYPDADGRTSASIVSYLRYHAVDHAAFYIGAPGVSVSRIHEETRLRDSIEEILDRDSVNTDAWTRCTATEVRREVQDQVEGDPSLRWALEPLDPPVRTLSWYGWVGLTLVAAMLSPVLVLGLLLVRMKELDDDRREARRRATAVGEETTDWDVTNENIRAVTAREDHLVQNQLSHVVEVKPGWVRRVALGAVLPALNFGARHIYNQGTLFGVSTLHFVRWVLIDGGHRLMFLTNYDGSMISYVGDFVNKSWQVPSALTAIWSNTVRFPPTRWLFFAGARDIPRFTAFLREHQVETQVWYSAYKRVTTGNVVNNAKIRRGLIGDLDEADTLEWLRRF